MYKKFLYGTACLLLAGFALAASPSLPEDATKCKATYTQKIAEFAQECATAKVELLARYRKTLDALRLEAKQKGDFDAVQAADAEIRRFEKQKNMPPVTPPPASPDLAKAAKLCREALDKAEQDSAQKVVDFANRYLQFLDLHVKQAVRDDKLDLAKAFNAEMKIVRESPEYQAAKFLIEDKTASTETVKADPPSDPAPSAADPGKTHPAAATNIPPPAVLAPPRIGKNGEKIMPRVDPDGMYDAQHILEGPPAATTSPFKSLTASETGKAAISGGIGIALDGYLDTESAQYQSKIKLRSKTVGTTFANLKVLTQFFVKNPNGGTAQEACMQFALVSSLSPKGTICEMKPSDPIFPSSYHWKGANWVQNREGSFLGMVVSVFSADDKLLGQVCSSALLKDRGRTTFDLPDTWMDIPFDSSNPRTFNRVRGRYYMNGN